MSAAVTLSLNELYAKLAECLLQDQFRLRRKLGQIKKGTEPEQQQYLQRIASELARSIALRQSRLPHRLRAWA